MKQTRQKVLLSAEARGTSEQKTIYLVQTPIDCVVNSTEQRETSLFWPTRHEVRTRCVYINKKHPKFPTTTPKTTREIIAHKPVLRLLL